jgi:8-oxo-dGTP pyrophosphatase MutT (NUDIX family)
MTVREDTVRREDGTEGIYGVVDKPTAAIVIPRDGDRLHLVEQFRYPVGKRRWEFPMGTAPERAEVDPADLAARELAEETGLIAGRMEFLGDLDLAPGTSSQREHVFLATDLREGPIGREDSEQDMQARTWSGAPRWSTPRRSPPTSCWCCTIARDPVVPATSSSSPSRRARRRPPGR